MSEATFAIRRAGIRLTGTEGCLCAELSGGRTGSAGTLEGIDPAQSQKRSRRSKVGASNLAQDVSLRSSHVLFGI
jgi:hypothetical protein